MAKESKKEYWMCIIGSTTRDRLPDGSDFPMRMPVRETFTKLTGQQAEHCWSGWGLTDKKRELIMKIWNMDEADLPNEIVRK